MGTHPDIRDKDLRTILANELLIIRKVHKRGGVYGFYSDLVLGIRVGLDTALRRVQFVRESEKTA